VDADPSGKTGQANAAFYLGGLTKINESSARMRPLDQLSRGLGLELTIIRTAEDPMLYLERRAYLMAIVNALSGVEAARVTLAKATQRLSGLR
jgi:hypothetical protein